MSGRVGFNRQQSQINYEKVPTMLQSACNLWLTWHARVLLPTACQTCAKENKILRTGALDLRWGLSIITSPKYQPFLLWTALALLWFCFAYQWPTKQNVTTHHIGYSSACKFRKSSNSCSQHPCLGARPQPCNGSALQRTASKSPTKWKSTTWSLLFCSAFETHCYLCTHCRTSERIEKA